MDNEIQELKEQLAALQKRIDREMELKDETIERALDSSIDRLRRMGTRNFWFCMFALVLVLVIMFVMKFSPILIAATFILLGTNLFLAYLIMVKYARIDRSGSLVEVTEQVLEYKKFNRLTTFCMLPFAFIWAVWYAYDAAVNIFRMSGQEIWIFALYMLFCGAIGAVIGYFGIYRPSMKQADRIARQIKDING